MAALAIYGAASAISPIASGVVVVAFAAILPWLINRGLRFNAAMTSWSNVRFRFDGSYWPAFRVFLLYPVLAIFSLYPALPFVTRAAKRYTIVRHRLGGHRLSFDCGIGPFYAAFCCAAVWAVFGLALAVGLVAVTGPVGDFTRAAQTGSQVGAANIVALMALAAAWFVAIFPVNTCGRRTGSV